MKHKIYLVLLGLLVICLNTVAGKTGADWDSAPEQTGTLLMRQS